MFIPVAEDTGLITEIGAWVINQACGLAALRTVKAADLSMAVNISTRQLRGDSLLDTVARALMLLAAGLVAVPRAHRVAADGERRR